jgi:hypothetical protein
MAVDANVVALCGDESTIEIRDLRSLQTLHTLRGHHAEVCA